MFLIKPWKGLFIPSQNMYIIYLSFIQSKVFSTTKLCITRNSNVLNVYCKRKSKARKREEKGWEKKNLIPPRRGIEPRSPAWQAGILTTILPRMRHTGGKNFCYLKVKSHPKQAAGKENRVFLSIKNTTNVSSLKSTSWRLMRLQTGQIPNVWLFSYN